MPSKRRTKTIWRRVLGWLKPQKTARPTGLCQRVLEALGPLGFGMTKGALVMALHNIPPKSLTATLRYLRRLKYVERRTDGAYGITQDGIHRRTIATACGLRRVRKTRLVNNDGTTTE